MPDHQNFKDLQDYSIAPPPHLTSAIFEEIAQNNMNANLSKLKDFNTSPSADLYNAIANKIIPAESHLKPGKIFIFKSFLKVAAAAILFIVGGYYFFWKSTLNSTDTPTIAGTLPKINPLPSAPQNIPPTIIPSEPIKIKADVVKLKKENLLKKTNTNQNSFRATKMIMDIDGTNYSILDNDLLATFTSFDPNKIPPFLLRESKEFTLVTIDNFTAINISPGMAEILNRMFKIKKNGKASRVSLKQNKKLLQWKSADINNFDINLMNNPLDPFDLGNFILAK